ncbi:MAG: hypothetical protein ABIJ56_01735 [Pseudomonadota bacterium]
MKKYFEAILVAFLAIWLVAGCNGDNDDKDTTEDVTPDPTGDEVTGDPTEDPTEDPTPDVTPDVTPDPTEDTVEDTIEDTVEEEIPVTCPEDDPPDHIYVDTDGGVAPVGGTDIEDLFVASISPLDALINPTPMPISGVVAFTDEEGLWALECLDVGDVDLGLVILVDDHADGTPNGIAGDYYPTGTGIKSWLTPAEKVDVPGATAAAVSNTVMAGLEAALGEALDADTDGIIMGMVINGATGAPIAGATVVNDASGPDLDIYYPSADFTALDGAATSATGIYLVPGPRVLTETETMGVADGFTFAAAPAATKGGFVYFQMMVGTPE